METSSQVVTTTTVIKDYDANTGNKIINNFMILKEIGRGVHGKVKLAQDMNTGQLVAIKIVDKKNRRRQMGYSLLRGNAGQPQQTSQQHEHPSKENELKIRREIAILRKCNHPNVVKLHEVMDDPTSRKIYMALEYTESGEIEWRDDQDRPVMTVDEARRIFRDIVNGLDYLHYQGIIHRDIKPANLLLSHDGVAKISDFGVSYYNDLLASQCQPNEEMLAKIDRELAETAGTPAFFAPELCCAGGDTLNRPRISKSIDIWALGVTLYCFIFGQCPFIAATEFELFDTIPTQPLVFPTGSTIDDELKGLLEKLLIKNPDQRITLDHVKRHPWVTADLINPEDWIRDTEPYHYLPTITVEPMMESSSTMMDRLRQSIRKLSFSFSHPSRRKSTCSTPPPPRLHNNNTSSRPLSYHPPQQQQYNNNMHRLSQPTMNKQPSYSTSLLPHATSSVTPTVSLSTGHTLVFNSGLSSSIIPLPPPPSPPQTSIHPLRPISQCYLSEEDEIEEQERPGLSRRVSSASSSSGIGLTFGKGMTPLET